MKLRVLTYAIKNQRKARNAPSRGHFVPKHLVGGFGTNLKYFIVKTENISAVSSVDIKLSLLRTGKTEKCLR